ncbi:hypothetical protein GCM10009677_20960 [Sphaerisporangium rubeum]|uniref:Mce-associated membrane protein n=1 Tax=Sphaerisporangium rubeum TaxID=321317 RepID=A0A7X0M533_9ACTN|nr:hypothetical protein [Sphaerisporangium rubeum]MBB6471797.1 Mce-associated membrane protein [Sphaerisporangium rubeum]
MAQHAARPRPRRRRLTVLVFLLVPAAVLGFAWVRVGAELDQARGAALDRVAAIQAAQRYALSLLAVSHRTVDRDVERVIESSTGQARADYARDAERLKAATRANKAVQTGVVRAAGLVSMDAHRSVARVLVVADSVVSWEGAKTAPQDRYYRWNVEVTKIDGLWWASKLENVP